jgi:hypothetical protein
MERDLDSKWPPSEDYIVTYPPELRLFRAVRQTEKLQCNYIHISASCMWTGRLNRWEIFAGIDAKEGVSGEAYHASHHLCEETCVFITQVSSPLFILRASKPDPWRGVTEIGI